MIMILGPGLVWHKASYQGYYLFHNNLIAVLPIKWVGSNIRYTMYECLLLFLICWVY